MAYQTQTVNSDQLIITQANSLVYAAYEMTLQEKRLLLLLISMVRKEHTKFHTYCIPVRQIAEFLGIDKNAIYRVVRATCKKLMSRVLDVQNPDGEWKQFHWVSTAHYMPKGKSRTGEAELELKIHDELHPLLLELKKQFASVPLEHIANLSSYHSIRIFEILFHKSHKLQNPKIRIELVDLKKSLGIEEKYPNFSNFEKMILKPAQKNLGEKTPIKFTYTKSKKGNKIVALNFVVTENPITENNQLELNIDAPRTLRFLQIEDKTEPSESERQLSPQQEILIRSLSEMGYTADGTALIDQIGEQAVQDVLALAREQKNIGKHSGKEIQNTGGLIAYLIKTEAWKPFAMQRKAREEARKKAERSKKFAELIESLDAEYDRAYTNHIDDYWQFTLTSGERGLVKENMAKNGDTFALQFLDKHGWDDLNPFFVTERNKALERLKLEPEIPEYLKSKENYLRSQPQYQSIETDIIEEVVSALK